MTSGTGLKAPVKLSAYKNDTRGICGKSKNIEFLKGF